MIEKMTVSILRKGEGYPDGNPSDHQGGDALSFMKYGGGF